VDRRPLLIFSPVTVTIFEANISLGERKPVICRSFDRGLVSRMTNTALGRASRTAADD